MRPHIPLGRVKSAPLIQGKEGEISLEANKIDVDARAIFREFLRGMCHYLERKSVTHHVSQR